MLVSKVVRTLKYNYGCEVCGKDYVEAYYCSEEKKFVCERCEASNHIPKGYKLYS